LSEKTANTTRLLQPWFQRFDFEEAMLKVDHAGSTGFGVILR
jgi:hypothetical protein